MAFGRPTKYNPDYCEQIIKFFNRTPFTAVLDQDGNPCFDKNGKPVLMPCALPTLSGFAISIGVHQETLLNWTHKHEDFFEAYKLAKTMQEEILVQNGLAGNYEKAFSIFLAKNITGMKDYKQIEIQSGEDMHSAKTLQTTKKPEKQWTIEFVNAEQPKAIENNTEDK